ncbi:hypothetical protein AG1IA_03523 [Rhizoctonia solani AG-1 IA]|uniref:Uncharacterized protein n=1 Tax=Thanatephorus cucumeris (strain AG1-IA) TaxID=983506 RepID=L8X1E4_THACA|nr:hypothetical protein AG1IA_03523 [Rhizoctonia solani AG-1 IA]
MLLFGRLHCLHVEYSTTPLTGALVNLSYGNMAPNELNIPRYMKNKRFIKLLRDILPYPFKPGYREQILRRGLTKTNLTKTPIRKLILRIKQYHYDGVVTRHNVHVISCKSPDDSISIHPGSKIPPPQTMIIGNAYDYWDRFMMEASKSTREPYAIHGYCAGKHGYLVVKSDLITIQSAAPFHRYPIAMDSTFEAFTGEQWHFHPPSAGRGYVGQLAQWAHVSGGRLGMFKSIQYKTSYLNQVEGEYLGHKYFGYGGNKKEAKEGACRKMAMSGHCVRGIGRSSS